jgi:hypothetical protein
MSWTNPRTWASGHIPTANTEDATHGALNAQIRDNLLLLKTPFDANAKLAALASPYVNDLSGVFLRGLVLLKGPDANRPDDGNTFTSGNHDFNSSGSARLIVPVGRDGRDLYAGKRDGFRQARRFLAPSCKAPGSTWVSRAYWKHVGADQWERRYLGTVISTPAGAKPGSGWQDTDSLEHYIDASGIERSKLAILGSHLDAAAKTGSHWIDVDNYEHYIAPGGQEWISHADVPAHSDAAHTDTHTNTHSDSHTNSHSDSHTNTGHGDSHSNTHTNSHSDTHSDTPHTDIHDDVIGETHGDFHGDVLHNDAHSNTHSDVAHSDSHTNASHQDSHGNVSHSDSHSNVAHVDSHSNVAHSDHADTHGDQPELVGPK